MTERGAVVSRSGDLLDVNVWLALAIEEHPHHPAAAAYWNAHAGKPRFFCRLSAMSFVRLLCNPKLMSGKPLTLVKAWDLYQLFANLPGVALLAEPAGLDEQLGTMVTPKLAPRLFTDAYFAALVHTARLRLVTFDKDFARFEALNVLRLTASDWHAAK